ncbi:hypothetical protein V502_01349 [Pseudogymnoascus sp. VKM F-4520 (FW-2644)]|nr:hypothetical protein V502_01349 [Pseudogymnoascus sp. VKM F-4520 (FW-2644)]
MAGGSLLIGGPRAAWDKQDGYDSPEAQFRERRSQRFRREHNDFWRDAFRIGENIRSGNPDPEVSPTVNPGLFMDDAWRNLYDRRQGRWPPLRRRTEDDSPLIENTRYDRNQMGRPMFDHGLYEADRPYDGEDYEDRLHYPY